MIPLVLSDVELLDTNAAVQGYNAYFILPFNGVAEVRIDERPIILVHVKLP